MRISLALVCYLISTLTFADTMNNYMAISSKIPQMEMKADPKSQAWARSGRSVLALTDEAIAETLAQANEAASREGHPIFCLPPGTQLNSSVISSVIANTYKDISSQQGDKSKMSVSQVAWMGMVKTYPCGNQQAAGGAMQHVGR